MAIWDEWWKGHHDFFHIRKAHRLGRLRNEGICRYCGLWTSGPSANTYWSPEEKAAVEAEFGREVFEQPAMFQDTHPGQMTPLETLGRLPEDAPEDRHAWSISGGSCQECNDRMLGEFRAHRAAREIPPPPPPIEGGEDDGQGGAGEGGAG